MTKKRILTEIAYRQLAPGALYGSLANQVKLQDELITILL